MQRLFDKLVGGAEGLDVGWVGYGKCSVNQTSYNKMVLLLIN